MTINGKTQNHPSKIGFSHITGNVQRAFPEKADSERGAAMLVALIVIAAFIILATTAARTVSAISEEAEKIEQTRQERSRAEYYLSMAEATLKYDTRADYNELQINGKQMELRMGGQGKLSMFDSLTEPSSRPLLNLDGSETGERPENATSLYGASSLWADRALAISRDYVSVKTAERQIQAPDSVEIISFREVYRRSMAGVTEPIYAFQYTVRARAGEFVDVVRDDKILLGPAFIEDSPVTVNCSDIQLTGAANPANVAWGNPTSLALVYTRSERIVIYNQGGTPIFNQIVSDDPAPQNISYTTAPLTGPTTFIGEAVRGTCQIQVVIPVGVTFDQSLSYTVNGAQSVNIIEGETIRYDWEVTNAVAGYTNSWITYGAEVTRHFENVYSNSVTQPGPLESTVSTLHVRDTRKNGGAEQTVTVNINVCRLPRVLSFTATPSSVTAGSGATVRFDWQTEYAAGVRIAGIDNLSANGSMTIATPASTTTYTLEAFSDCGAPSATSQTIVTVTQSCTPPSIASFAVNPQIVTSGGSQTIQFTWNVTGQADSISIDNGIGSSLPSSGAIDAAQPQSTTTYTITATGCNQTAQFSQTVQVGMPPPPPPCAAQQIGDDFKVAISYKYAPLGIYANSFIVPKQTPILRWVAINAQAGSVRINGQPVPPKGEMLLNGIGVGEHAYTITATSLDGSTAKSDYVRFTTLPGNGQGTLTVSPNPLPVGAPVTVYDSASGTQTYNFGEHGYPSPDNPAFGNYGGTLERYGFWQYGSSQEPYFGTYAYLQTVPADTSCPLIRMFAASPYIVTQPGTTIRLNWTIENATRIVIDGVGDVTGRQYIDIPAPASDTNYRMVVTGANGCTDQRTALLIVKQKGWLTFGGGSAGSGLSSAFFSGSLNTPENSNLHLNLYAAGVLLGGPPSAGGITRVQVFNGNEIIYDGVPPATGDEFGGIRYETDIAAPACRKVIHLRYFFYVTYCQPFGGCDTTNGTIDTRFPNSYSPLFTDAAGNVQHSQTGQFVGAYNSLFPTSNSNFPMTGFYY